MLRKELADAKMDTEKRPGQEVVSMMQQRLEQLEARVADASIRYRNERHHRASAKKSASRSFARLRTDSLAHDVSKSPRDLDLLGQQIQVIAQHLGSSTEPPRSLAVQLTEVPPVRTLAARPPVAPSRSTEFCPVPLYSPRYPDKCRQPRGRAESTPYTVPSTNLPFFGVGRRDHDPKASHSTGGWWDMHV